MTGRIVRGRFFVFLALIAALTYFVARQFFPSAPGMATVTSASKTETWAMQAVVMRDETVVSTDVSSTVYLAQSEGALVTANDAVAEVYTAAYSDKERQRLETTRADIRAYHTTLLQNIVDAELDRLDAAVQSKALEIKTLMSGTSVGSLSKLEAQLEEAMEARRLYLSQNRRQDSKLNALYEEEGKREAAISSWQSELLSGAKGVVSYYLDGCEQFLSPENLGSVSLDDLHRILAGWQPDFEGTQRTQSVCRVISQGKWYLLVIVSDSRFSAVTGQRFDFQMKGYEDVIYTGVAVSMQTGASETMLVLEVDDPIGPLEDARGGRVTLGAQMEGLYVPVGALAAQNGQTGVFKKGAGEDLFVPVRVLSRDASGALVEPIETGALLSGETVSVP